MTLSVHGLALIEGVGSLLVGLGSMYWAYELLGGQNGPMNLLTRTVSYSLMFGVGYGIVWGPWFGTIAGIGFGIFLSVEQLRVARHQRRFGSSPLNHLPSLGAARGVVLGCASIHPFGWQFALLFGLLSAAGLYLLYRLGYAPTFDYRSHTRPVLTGRRVKASLWRGAVIGAAGTLSGLALMNEYTSIVFGIYVGLTVAGVSVFVSTFSPFVEYWADHLPDRQLAALGVVVMLMGMAMQSVQYIVVLLDIPVR